MYGVKAKNCTVLLGEAKIFFLSATIRRIFSLLDEPRRSEAKIGEIFAEFCLVFSARFA